MKDQEYNEIFKMTDKEYARLCKNANKIFCKQTPGVSNKADAQRVKNELRLVRKIFADERKQKWD